MSNNTQTDYRSGQPYRSTQYVGTQPTYDSQRSPNPNTNNRFQETELHEYDTGRPERTPLRAFGGEGDPDVPSNPLSEFLAEFLEGIVNFSMRVSHELYTNSSVIVLAAGLAGGVHHFASPLSSLANAAMDSSFHGSVAVAKYVGLAFFIKTALTPIHEAFAPVEKQDNVNSRDRKSIDVEIRKAKDFINSHVISYLTPMALAWIVAYTQGIPVKLGIATVYTIGTFGMMKVLSRGYDHALFKWDPRKL
jgi:hypothetical protein